MVYPPVINEYFRDTSNIPGGVHTRVNCFGGIEQALLNSSKEGDGWQNSFPLLVLLQSALGCIRSRCQRHYRIKEFLRLTGEKQVVRKRYDSGDGASMLGQGRSDHRTGRQFLANEVGRLGQDQVGLELLSPERFCVEIGKSYKGFGGLVGAVAENVGRVRNKRRGHRVWEFEEQLKPTYSSRNHVKSNHSRTQ